jgi:hypothetical protein
MDNLDQWLVLRLCSGIFFAYFPRNRIIQYHSWVMSPWEALTEWFLKIRWKFQRWSPSICQVPHFWFPNKVYCRYGKTVMQLGCMESLISSEVGLWSSKRIVTFATAGSDVKEMSVLFIWTLVLWDECTVEKGSDNWSLQRVEWSSDLLTQENVEIALIIAWNMSVTILSAETRYVRGFVVHGLPMWSGVLFSDECFHLSWLERVREHPNCQQPRREFLIVRLFENHLHSPDLHRITTVFVEKFNWFLF